MHWLQQLQAEEEKIRGEIVLEEMEKQTFLFEDWVNQLQKLAQIRVHCFSHMTAQHKSISFPLIFDRHVPPHWSEAAAFLLYFVHGSLGSLIHPRCVRAQNVKWMHQLWVSQRCAHSVIQVTGIVKDF